MFGDLYDALSKLWSWSWPTVDGEATAVDVERQRHSRGGDTLRLSVTYKFFVGSDGPYTGQSFWSPALFRNKKVVAARHKIHIRQRVSVRYRADDPSVNRLDRSIWEQL
jgi:hypothetical protein